MNANALMSILEMVKGFQKEIAEMKDTMRSNHQDEIRRIEQNFALEKRQINETHQHECDTYKIDIGQKRSQIICLNNMITSKNTKVNSLENSLTEKVHLIENFQQTLKDKGQLIGKLQIDLNTKVQENDDLKRINNAKDLEYKKIKTTLNEQIQTNGNLQVRVNTKENENNDLKKKLENKENENTNLRNSERSKSDENNRLERLLRDANQKIDNLNSTINEKSREIRNLQSTINEYKREKEYNENSRDVSVVFRGFSNTFTNKIINELKKSYNVCDNLRSRAKYICDFLDKEYPFKNVRWQYILIEGCYDYEYFSHENVDVFVFKMGGYYIILFRSVT